MEQLLEQLKCLKLTAIIKVLKEQSDINYQELDFDTRLSFLLETEILRRKNNRIKFKLKNANLKLNACFEDIIFSNERNLDKKLLLELQSFNWIKNNKNLLITGATGVGKTYLASSFINNFCRNDTKAKYYKTSEIVNQLSLAKTTGKYYDVLIKLSKLPLLAIDEWLREPLSQEAARDILDLIDERYRKTSIIFCSQLPVSDWHKMIKDATCADAILDRIVHDSIRIELKGQSMRQKTAKQTDNFIL